MSPANDVGVRVGGIVTGASVVVGACVLPACVDEGEVVGPGLATAPVPMQPGVPGWLTQ